MKERDFYFDNAKFILIFLVVLGHYCGCYLNSRFLLGCYDAIYSFHMPAFILISGFLSKNIKQQRYKDIDTILLPYFVIQVIYILYRKFLGMPQSWSIAIPIDANWFLLGLFIWRLIIPYFNYIKYPVAVAVILALSIGFLNEFGKYLDLERIITFFPFFVIGYFLPCSAKSDLLKYKHKLYPWILFFFFAAGFFALSYLFPGKASFLRKCFIPEFGYDLRFGEYAGYGIFFRLFSYVISLILVSLFFILVPDRKTWYSYLGTRTIHVFLFHLIILYLIGNHIAYFPFISELLAFPLAATITLLLSSKYLAPYFEVVLNLHNYIFNALAKLIAQLRERFHSGNIFHAVDRSDKLHPLA